MPCLSPRIPVAFAPHPAESHNSANAKSSQDNISIWQKAISNDWFRSSVLRVMSPAPKGMSACRTRDGVRHVLTLPLRHVAEQVCRFVTRSKHKIEIYINTILSIQASQGTTELPF